MKSILLSLCLLATMAACKQQPKTTQQSIDSIGEQLTAQLDSLYQLGNINGYGVAIVDSSGILYEKGFGFRHIKDQKPYTTETVQNIGSVSKTFIGIGLLKAEELGILSLEDPVNKHLPFKVENPHFPQDTIRIHHLASHISGIRDTESYDQLAYVSVEKLADSLHNVVEETFNPPEDKVSMLEFLPALLVPGGKYYSPEVYLAEPTGTRFEYSNIGATLAALVLEQASGVPFDQFTDQHILEPLGMDHSGWNLDQIKLEKHSVLYADNQREIPLYELITYPDGGLRSSTHDMGLYLSELISAYGGQGQLLEKNSYEKYFRPVLDDSHFEERDAEFPYNDEYNEGIFIGYSGTGLIGHTGGDPGISSFMFFDPSSGLGRYLMINTSITNEAGVNQLFGIMQALEEYSPQWQQ